MQKTLKEIAEKIGGRLVGDGNYTITGVSGIREAVEGDITFVSNPKYAKELKTTRASAVIISEDIEPSANKNIIVHKNPSLAFSQVIDLLYPEEKLHPTGIHPKAVTAPNVKIGSDVSIHAYSVIEEDTVIGDGTVVFPFVYIGKGCKIGKNCLLYPNITIREKSIIGDRVIIHSGSVIGADGFGYLNLDGEHKKIPQIGTVEIEDDVEIGANVTIDRARFDKTIIKRGTKIDNLAMIAHNVKVGENTLIIAQAGISGSTEIGNNVILAGQAGLVGHIKVGDNAVVGAQAGVTKSVPSGTIVSGYPARPHRQQLKLSAFINKLPELAKKIDILEQKLNELKDQLSVKK